MNANAHKNERFIVSRKPKKVRSLGYVAGVDEFLEAHESQLSSRHTDAPHMLAAYLRQQLNQRTWEPDYLAQKLDAPPQYVKLLLKARIPQSKIDRDILLAIAETFDADPKFIFRLVGRQIVAEKEQDEMVEARQDLSEHILDEISNVLLTTIDSAYNTPDLSQTERYEHVLKELHRIIAKQREDLRSIKDLIHTLNDPELMQTVSTNIDKLTDLVDTANRAGYETEPVHKNLPDNEIVLMKQRLQRIVEHIEKGRVS